MQQMMDFDGYSTNKIVKLLVWFKMNMPINYFELKLSNMLLFWPIPVFLVLSLASVNSE